jgi:hypothetical protein
LEGDVFKPVGRFLVFVVVLIAVSPAHAEQASVALSPAVAVWNDTVKVTITGAGCSATASSPVYRYVSGPGYVIDIDLTISQCPVSGAAFSTGLTLGPLPATDYTVRVYDANTHAGNPSLPPLATAPLKVHPQASLDVVVPDVVTDAAPFKLVFRGTASSPCFSFDPPVVSGKTITATFDDNCPILPPIGPTLIDEEATLGPLPAGDYEILFFNSSDWPQRGLYRRTLTVYDDAGCVPSPTALCLQGNRFRVEVAWKDFEGHTGNGHAVPLQGGGDSGLFWFFQQSNIELTAKVLDGCSYNNGWWVFLSSGSTVEYKVKVTDTKTGRTKTYDNALGVSAPLVADTAAFSCAP